MTINEIGRLVRMRRRDSGLRQDELASIAGVGTRFLSELENGKASLELGKVLRVLQTLGLEISLTARKDTWPHQRVAS